MTYYNDFDPFVCEWTRELMAAGLITEGYVDERPIQKVQPEDLVGYSRLHFFSGIAGWDHALNLASWPDGRSIWTVSAPCQPWSVAGKQKGEKDERHLWPDFFRLVRQCRPDTILGEQVEGAINNGWLDGVSSDLEREGYAVGSCVLGAASAGAPHIRHRIFFVATRLANDQEQRLTQRVEDGRGGDGGIREEGNWSGPANGSSSGGLADTTGAQWGQDGAEGRTGSRGGAETPERCCDFAGGLGHSNIKSGQERDISQEGRQRASQRPDAGRSGVRLGHSSGSGLEERSGERGDDGPQCQTAQRAGGQSFWDASRVILCRDGKYRRIPVKSSIQFVAARVPSGLDSVRPESGNQEGKEGEVDGTFSQTGPDQELRALPENHDKETIQRCVGIDERFPSSPVLRQELHGECDGGPNKNHQPEELPETICQGGETDMRVMREGFQTACPPQGRMSDQQRPIQFADVVQSLPSSIALAELGHDDRTAKALQALFQTYAKKRTVLYSSHEIQKVWQSLDEEDQGRLYLDLVRAGFVVGDSSSLLFPLSKKTPNRTKILRGAGNAICPQVAALFIQAFLETEQ